MRRLWSVAIFFIILIVLMTTHKQLSGFRGEAVGGGGSGSAYQPALGFEDMKQKETFRGEAVGGGGSGSAYQPALGFQDLNEAELIYKKKKEGFRGESISAGHTAGPNNIGDLGSAAEFFSEQKEKNKAQVHEAFQNISPASVVTGTPETSDVSGPANATLNEPRKPYNLLQDLPPAPRGSISCLTAGCCAETDFEQRTNQTGNFLQRTNNYKREFPDSCSAPLTELNLAFYNNAILKKA